MTLIPTEDALYPGIPDHVYHADLDSLSSSGARSLLARTPAHFDHERRRQPRKPKRAYDYGHLAHMKVLGEGGEFVVLDPEVHGLKKDGTVADNPRATATWKAAEAQARERNAVPVHIDDWRKSEAMLEQVRQHRIAGPLLELPGYAELSGYWTDPITGVRLRFRPDYLIELPDGRIVCIDYKTALESSVSHFEKNSADYGYFQQEPWYCDGITALGVGEPKFLFIVQEKDPPFLVNVIEHHPDDVSRGRDLNRIAINLYADCIESGVWPGYDDTGVHTARLHSWQVRRQETLIENLTAA